MLRKILFWTHLTVGVTAGVVIFIMSVTGVLLTYEKQLKEWDESLHTEVSKIGQPRLTTDQVLDVVREKHPEDTHFYLRWVNEEGRAIPVWAGRQRYLISPYSGDILQTGQSWLGESFHVITDLHRWLGFHDEEQVIGKEITAYSNLLFLFLIISGAYLWFPKKWRWSAFKSNLLLKRKTVSHVILIGTMYLVFG